MIKLDKEACVIGKTVLCGIVLGASIYLIILFWMWLAQEVVS